MFFYYILFYLFIGIGLIYTIHLALYIVSANIQDIKMFRKKHRNLQQKPKTIRPLVSVIIPAFNEALNIRACLDSVRSNTYGRKEVIVHNDNSTDETAKIVRMYKKEYPDFNLRLISRRTQNGKAHGVNYAVKRYAKGKLIMTLDGDCLLDKNAIKYAVQYFVDPSVVGVAANVKIINNQPSLLGLLQKFEHMIGYRSKHFYSLANCEFIVGGVASTYRHNTLREVGYYGTDTQTEDIGLSMKIAATGNIASRIVYAENVVAITGGVQSMTGLIRQRYRWKVGMLQNLLKYRSLAFNTDAQYSRMLTHYRIPFAFLSEFLLLLEPIILIYLLYASFVYQTPSLFLGAYATLTLYVLWVVLPDPYLTKKEKFQLCMYAPIMYFVFYIMNIVQLSALLKIFIKPSVLWSGKKMVSFWTPPSRINLIAKS